ncbi:hypothetical protein EMIHUDRAFT_200431 [Emiliania huxleyi CCMP1516]|uniref:Helicase C-terminal domain-containing protein n=2 Tax=Emiliania huxleyi TaxID=2903 RepID=A0A0D3KQK0_EMIH1|nr:hypothetical protein EMIHUDRAFT_200431 [Emiliania huxleyi CCMP1516]EOD38035.1 hypothetical protein EMIHUDRAFT_200431 [Emiliania huxleyi CCMP1516]|eukprot:XP_005790464.1 hypothetical protein EMIHUDRAFT_200431 [Emiliania huxleyi CCMP1516]
MTREALAANTLVSLPTGFGKTFVAAAVMRNFLRWFPDGLVVFMAPTRPLVHQQRDACAKADLPADGEAALLTGDLPPSERRALWSTGHGSEGLGVADGRRVVCVAHHAASAGYAYAKVAELLRAVQRVVRTLRICSLEARAEGDADLLAHTHCRAALLRSLLLPPAEEAAARLRGAHALDADPSCEIDASALCRARARLERCAEKLLADLALLAALLRTTFRAAVAAGYPPPLARAGVALACSSDTTVSEAVRLMPKWRELTALLSRHAAEQPHSRAIVFVGRRDTVSALCAARASHSDGAGAAGMPQAEQQRVLAAFRAGAINVLIATSVAEEGLDIGQVDLIVCLDAVASPIRLVQRFGRTGACYSRKRDGACVLLLTEAEERQYEETQRQAARLQAAVDIGRGIDLCAVDPAPLSAEDVRNLRCRFTRAPAPHANPSLPANASLANLSLPRGTGR